LKHLGEGDIPDPAHLETPVAAHGAVEDEIKMAVKRPDRRVVSGFFVGKNLFLIQIKIEAVGEPLHRVEVVIVMEVCHFNLGSYLRPLAVVIGGSVDRVVDGLRNKTEKLHNVDFAASGPAAVEVVHRHHPKGGPDPAPGRKLHPGLKTPVEPAA